ncbi:class I SAM-dependent methyltransferase [Microbacterium sp. GCS4]|uniref:class I SAM-dependent methyltransferase n=1 Tax=Microbacterium sp. GCS4 TaxID=1692239 RepID=UPI000681C619|nr:class I SAM-dependent methyltransferase [Microbacterium sp. GCS4]KNY06193.1 SAM-dependent methyltransferase [Microbacterium sp. GCS4]
MSSSHSNHSAYWNHNAAYHPWILRRAARCPRGRALDIGCGDGLLAQRLADAGLDTVGLEPDPVAADRARERTRELPRVTILESDLDSFDGAPRSFDIVTMVATLHHMDSRAALGRAVDLLRPGGALLVVGLAANRSVADRAFSAATFPAAWLGSLVHRETRDVGVRTALAQETLTDIRALARDILPGARIRRGLYYRYLLSWQR